MPILLINAKIYRNVLETDPVEAILLKEGVVSWIGSSKDAPACEKVLDLGGRVVVPGLTDSHIHLFMLALSRLQISFARTPVNSISSLVRKLVESSPDTQAGGWLQGCDLIEDRLVEHRLPTCTDLDVAFPDRPVLLRRYCGHVAIMNSSAMRALNVGANIPNPEGGIFRRDNTGALNGIAEEAAAEWVFSRAPSPSNEEIAAEILVVMQQCLALGLTSLVEAAVGFSIGYDREAAVWEHLRATYDIPVRMGFMLQLNPAEAAKRGLKPNWSRDWSTETLKYFADGIIGGRSGAVSVPYEDTGGTGYMMYQSGILEDMFKRSHTAGWRIAVHATGDRGIQNAVDAIVAAQGVNCDRRHRIEHCFLPPDELFSRLAVEGISVVMQPGFLSRMGGSIINGLGKRSERAYPGASVLAAGGQLAFSSDAPTGPLSPWQGIHDAVTRIGHNGALIGAKESVSNRVALDAYISGGAYVMRHEKFRGELSLGMVADLVVLNHNPLTVVPDTLINTHALLSIKAGEIVHNTFDCT